MLSAGVLIFNFSPLKRVPLRPLLLSMTILCTCVSLTQIVLVTGAPILYLCGLHEHTVCVGVLLPASSAAAAEDCLMLPGLNRQLGIPDKAFALVDGAVVGAIAR